MQVFKSDGPHCSVCHSNIDAADTFNIEVTQHWYHPIIVSSEQKRSAISTVRQYCLISLRSMTGLHDVNNTPRSLRCSLIQRGVEVEVVEFGGNSRAAKLLMQCSEAMQWSDAANLLLDNSRSFLLHIIQMIFIGKQSIMMQCNAIYAQCSLILVIDYLNNLCTI